MRRLVLALVLVCLLGWSLEASQVTLAWEAPTANTDESTPADVTGYYLYYRTAAQAYSAGQRVNAGNVLTGTVTGLTPGTLYYFTVTAYNATSESVIAQETGEVAPGTSPTVPVNLRVALRQCRRVRLRWEAAWDDVAVTQYRVRRGGAQIATTTGSTRVYDDRSVSPSTAYTYTVRASDVDAHESGDSNTVNVTTPACP